MVTRSLEAIASLPATLRPGLGRLFQRVPRGRVRKVIRTVFANCGGRNHPSRFAGNLVRPDLTDPELESIYHALILRNGVRKTSYHGRNTEQLRLLLASGDLVLPGTLRVLELGASLGVDAYATAELLRKQGRAVVRYVLGDLYTHVLYDAQRGLVFDQDGVLLQVKGRRSFVSVNFTYFHPVQRILNLPHRVLPWVLRRRYECDPGAQLVRIPLVHPSLRVDDPASCFRLERMDVFGSLTGKYDLVVCMNLLLPQYFSSAQIELATRNLVARVAPGGSLVVGSDGSVRVMRLSASGTEAHWRCFGNGAKTQCDRCTSPGAASAVRDAEGGRRCEWVETWSAAEAEPSSASA